MIPVLENNVKELEADCYLMGYNGGECVKPLNHKRERVFKTPLPEGAIDRLIDYALEHNHFLNIYLDGELRSAPTEETRKYPERYSHLNQATYNYVESLDELRGTLPTKALFIKHDEKERDLLHETIHESGSFKDLHYTKTHSYNNQTGQEYLEFMHPEVHKGTGLMKLCSYLNISVDNVVAFGDANNDIELLRTAGTGICMAQGSKEAKNAANYVSKFTNDEHGVAKELAALAEH